MGKQIHKRLPKDLVKDLIETFCAEEIGTKQASEGQLNKVLKERMQQ